MKPQQLRLPLGQVTMRQFDPVPIAQAGARAYAKQRGRSYSQRGLANAHVDPQKSFAIQQVYRKRMEEGPESSPGIEHSYGALREEIADQHSFLTRPREEGGLGITHEVVPHDPYATPQEMSEDVRKNRRIRTVAAATTSSADAPTNQTHQTLSDEDNDRFRAVHDVFGHAATGRGFSRHGEEAAYLSHVQMFSPAARQAATSELRGQNSYLNFSPQGGFPDTGGKAVGVPDWAQRTPFNDRRR